MVIKTYYSKTRNMVAEWWYYGEIVRLFRIDSAIFMFFFSIKQLGFHQHGGIMGELWGYVSDNLDIGE